MVLKCIGNFRLRSKYFAYGFQAAYWVKFTKHTGFCNNSCHPGTLPKVNKKQWIAIKMGIACDCEITRNYQVFDRKNVFYSLICRRAIQITAKIGFPIF